MAEEQAAGAPPQVPLREVARAAKASAAASERRAKAQRERVTLIMAAHRKALDLASTENVPPAVKVYHSQLLEISDKMLVPAGTELKALRAAAARDIKEMEFALARVRAARLSGPAAVLAEKMKDAPAKAAARDAAVATWREFAKSLKDLPPSEVHSVKTALALALHKVAEAEDLLAESAAAAEAYRAARAACASAGAAVERHVEVVYGNGAGQASWEERERAKEGLPGAVSALLSSEASAVAANGRRSTSGWSAVEALLRAAEVRC